MDGHNLIALLDAGLLATVNSDDPAYFGGYMNANFIGRVRRAAADGAPRRSQLARNSFAAAFLEPEAKRALPRRSRRNSLPRSMTTNPDAASNPSA